MEANLLFTDLVKYLYYYYYYYYYYMTVNDMIW